MECMDTPSPPGVVAGSREGLDIDRLFHQYSPYVAAIGLRLLGRDSEIEDLVQDVFLEALWGIGQLRDQDAIRGWLATVCVRMARKRLRRRRLRSFILGGDSVDYSCLIDPAASPEQRLLLTRSYQVLEKVPANYRVAWTLRHIQGESLSEVAAHCECSLATVKRWIQSAHDILQRELNHV